MLSVIHVIIMSRVPLRFGKINRSPIYPQPPYQGGKELEKAD